MNNYLDISEYARYKGTLYVGDNVIFYRDRVLVPPSLRKLALEISHSTHQGAPVMKLRAQSLMFWPRITCDIEKTRENCKEYNHNAPSEAHLSAEPINPLPTPLEQVFADFFNLRVVIISLSVTVCPEGPRFIVRHRESNMLVLRP